jgi:hypothetical protein
MSKYVNAKNKINDSKETPKAEEYGNSRRINSSMSQLSISHRVNSSKSKTKKKKKSTHIKSHSNIPMYHDQHISNKGSAKKQYSDSKGKKKKYSKHVHHQSEANVSTSITNKNNVLMIDSAIGIKAYINLPISPNSGRPFVIPNTKIISTHAMVKGGIKDSTPQTHARAPSDNYPYRFTNNNHHIYTSGPNTLDGRDYKPQPKSKEKKPYI